MNKLPVGCNLKCRACAHRMMSQKDSEIQKETWLKGVLSHWTYALNPIVSPLPERRWGYRNKVSLIAEWNSYRWIFGMNVRKQVISLQECPIHSATVKNVLAWLSSNMPPFTLFPLSIYVQAGAQATLILKTKELPNLDWLKNTLNNLNQTGLEGLWLHLHPSAGRRLFGSGVWKLLWGKPRSYNEHGLIYGPTAFQQLIPELYNHSLLETIKFLSPQKDSGILDLYSGSGATLRQWTDAGSAAIGVETSAEAIENAAINAPGARLLRGTCSQRLPQLNEWIKSIPINKRLAYVNPPRTGIEPDVREWLAIKARPQRIAYLSCSAGTLARDLLYLEEKGYEVKHITPYDFFPNTYHVETLACLSL